MLTRLFHATTAAFRAFHVSLLSREADHSGQPRHAWDDGTDYDIPTFLRRRAAQSA